MTDVFPALLALPLGLLLHLITLLLTPLYNSTPLRLHVPLLYALYGIPSGVIYAIVTLHYTAQGVISARVCLTIVAIAGDLVIVMGRRIGGIMGAWVGPEYGALLARLILGIGIVGGANAFALLCFVSFISIWGIWTQCKDHVIPLAPTNETAGRIANIANVAMRTGGYIMHIYYAEKAWTYLLGGATSFLVQHPEKSVSRTLKRLVSADSRFYSSPSCLPCCRFSFGRLVPMAHPSLDLRIGLSRLHLD